MQKVYLLLRNNRQSGPFTIDELWQQQLRSTDMVWIEGKSTAWAYLSELELLPTGEASANTPPASGEIERKAEELRRRALSAAPHHHLRNLPEEFNWESAEEKEEEPSIDFIDHRKEKNNVVSELLMTVLIIGLFAGGLYGGRNFFMEKKSAISPAASKLESTDRHEAVQANRIMSETPEPLASQDSTRSDSLMKDSSLLLSLEKPRTVLNKKSAKESSFVRHDSIPPVVNLSAKTDAMTPPPVQPQSSADNQVQQVADANMKKDSTSTEPAVKKKTLGQALRGLFHKKKKEEENQADSSAVKS